MMLQATRISDEAVSKATGRTWAEWVEVLDQAGAREMTHREIVRWLYDTGQIADGRWCQGVTVGYEQAIGRREVNQNCYGEYVASATKTLPGELDLDSTLELWLARVAGRIEFNEVSLAGELRVSASEKWRYWRVSLADGSQISVNISRKRDGRMLLGLEHKKLADKAAVDAWKRYWKDFLGSVDEA